MFLFALVCLVLVVPFKSVAQVHCYGPYTFQTCEDLGSGARTTAIHNGYDTVGGGYDTPTGQVFQEFSTRLGKTTYADSIDFHGRTGLNTIDNYAPSRYHFERRNFDKKNYSYECSILLGCY